MHATNHFPKLKKDTQSLIKELLLHFLKDDKHTIDEAREKAMNRRKEIIEEHRQSRSIWQNLTTGKWCTKLGPDKHLVVRKNKEDLHNAIVEYYLLNATHTPPLQRYLQIGLLIWALRKRTVSAPRTDIKMIMTAILRHIIS